VGERRWKKAPDEEVQPAKTLWDWLQLLVVPAILIGITFAWSATQTRSDNRREDRRIEADRAAAEETRQDATLQGYLNQMSGLMLDKRLLASNEGDAVRAVARTVTLTALRRLDGERKGEVVRFLQEAGLLEADEVPEFRSRLHVPSDPVSKVDLEEADLTGADLRRADLEGANLGYVNLTGANLKRAFLWDVNLLGANLTHANLEDVNALGADLSNANFTGASLAGAFLRQTNLVASNFADADLRAANLEGAELGSAKHLDPDGARNLDLDRFITEDLGPRARTRFLRYQWDFLTSLSPTELAKFKLSPERLAELGREAGMP
jgi:uncharacterized protein YjbI with pentapeptide repeats